MSDARRDGLKLHYRREGSGDPPLVFIHGWCCDHTFFQPQFDRFKASHDVVTLDLRGCGQSEVPAKGYDIPTLADDVARLCHEIGLSKPVLLGHSLGGMIAIELAARYPPLAAAVVAIDPGPIDPLPQSRKGFEDLIRKLEGPDGDPARRAYVADLFLPTDDPERKRRIIEVMSTVPPGIAAAMLRGILGWNGVGALGLCQVPLLVLLAATGGSNDPARLVSRKPDIHIGVTIGTGHFNQLDAPEQVTPMIERFLRIAVKP